MFNHNILEQDIERISKEVQERKNRPEFKNLPERENVKQSLEPLIRKPLMDQASNSGQSQSVNFDVLPDYLISSPQEIKLKVKELIDLTLHQGIEKTVATARKFGPYILDAYHDALTDKLYDEFKKRGIL